MTDVLTDAAVELIEQHNASAKPLFLLLNHLAPHSANLDNPMQAPADELAKFGYIANETERYYAAMVSRMDRSVGQVIDALARQQMLQQSIVLFLSDNGGPTVGQHATTASNYPLRGVSTSTDKPFLFQSSHWHYILQQKNSPWEGGLRSSAAIWSKEFERLGSVWKQRFYIGDLLPTLAAAAEIQLNASLQLDGLNLWSALKYGYESVEREIVHNIDELEPYLVYTHGKWKIVNGTTNQGLYDGWLAERYNGEMDPRAAQYEEIIRNTSVWQHLQRLRGDLPEVNISSMRLEATLQCPEAPATGKPCLPLVAPCLFDIDEDPCERNNLYEEHRNESFLLELWQRIEQFRRLAREPGNKPDDPKCDPRFYNNEWTWWQDERSRGSSLLPITLLINYFVLLLLFGLKLF